MPAFAWRGGFVRRALTIGPAVGVVLGVLAWLDSGLVFAGVCVLVIVGVFYGVWMARRMKRYWPGAEGLSAAERVKVVRAARRGERITDARLTPAALDYRTGIHAAAEEAKPFRWLLPVVLAVGVATAGWDAAFGSWGNAVASFIYLVMLLAEVLWWPRRRARLLSNVDRASSTPR
ncbi:hypothetical protein ABQE44_16040 [Mycolicibacterium sp. XJ2546]